MMTKVELPRQIIFMLHKSTFQFMLLKAFDVLMWKMAAELLPCLRTADFPEHWNYAYLNIDYIDFIANFFSAIDFLVPVKTLSVKANTKSWSDIYGLKTIPNRHKQKQLAEVFYEKSCS